MNHETERARLERERAILKAKIAAHGTPAAAVVDGEAALIKKWGYGHLAHKIGCRTGLEAWDKLSEIVGAYSNGTFLLRDGRVVTKEEIRRGCL